MEFDMYEQDYLSLKDKFKDDISAYSRLLEDDKYRAIEKMKKLLADADQQLKHMEREAQASKSGAIVARVKKYRSDHTESRRKLMQEEEKILDLVKQKNLFGNSSRHVGGFETDEIREKLINTNEKAYSQTVKLQDASKVAYEAESLAIQASTNLRGQRDMLHMGIDEAKGLNRELHITQKIEDRIARKNRCVKLLLWMIIVILFATNVTVLILKIKK